MMLVQSAPSELCAAVDCDDDGTDGAGGALLCGGGIVKTAVIKAEEGILKTAAELQLRVQVRSHPTLQNCITRQMPGNS